MTLLKHKVLAYITHGERLLIFSHPDCPEAGLQVPAGTLEPGEDPAEGAMREAWETVQRGHAIANGLYVAAANRAGVEGEITFWGQSFVADYHGRVVARASADREEILVADCDIEAAEDFRRVWPFFRDRRADSYGGLAERHIED